MERMRRLGVLAVPLLILLAGAGPAFAQGGQGNGTLVGTVVDNVGVIPGATVTATHVATNTSRTGTTNEQMDAWFIGYTPELVAGAWVGFDEKRTLGREETGGRAAVPIWLEFMQAATESGPITDFAIPEGIVFANIDRKSGLRAAPGDDDLLLECFRRGSEPAQMLQRAHGPASDDFFRGDF